MPKVRNNILTIAGFDPTGGAGLLADIKVFEQHRLLGFAIQTANTIQTEDQFKTPNWIDHSLIFEQLDTLLDSYSFDVVKIGLVEHWEFLNETIQKLRNHNSHVQIIWDPILSSSSGFTFHENEGLEEIDTILSQIDWLTPNWNEAKKLIGNDDVLQGAQELASLCKVFLKGGHNSSQPGKDYLLTKEKIYPFNPMGKKVSEKHGSGCIFSSSLASNLALGYPIIKACLKAKNYTTRVLESNNSKLGYHKF